MQAIVFHEFGPPNVLRLEDVPTPEPGPGEVLLKVHGVSVNRTLDLVVRSAFMRVEPPLPHVLGVDPCGVITDVGPDVTDRKVGDRVVCGPIIGVDPNRGTAPARRECLGRLRRIRQGPGRASPISFRIGSTFRPRPWWRGMARLPSPNCATARRCNAASGCW